MQILRDTVKVLGSCTWVLPLAYMGLITTLSHLPSKPDGGLLLMGWEVQIQYGDLLHIPLYAVLAIFWKIALEGRLQGVRSNSWVVILLCGGFGFLDEWHQSFVPGRDASLTDALADILGAVLTCCCWPKLRPLFFNGLSSRPDSHL